MSSKVQGTGLGSGRRVTLGHLHTNVFTLDEMLGRQLKEEDFSSGAPGVKNPVFPENFVPQVSRTVLLSGMTVHPLGHLRAV